MENLQKAINSTQEKDAIDFKQAIQTELASRLHAAIVSRKDGIAKTVSVSAEETNIEPSEEVSEANTVAPSAPVAGGKVGIHGSERSNSGAGEVIDPLVDELKCEIESVFAVKDGEKQVTAKDDDISLDPNFEKEFYIKEMEYNGHKVVLKQVGLGLSKPVRVYVDDKRWEFFPGPESALKASKSYIDDMVNSKNESLVSKDNEITERVELDGRGRLYLSTESRLEQARKLRELKSQPTNKTTFSEEEQDTLPLTNKQIMVSVNMKNGKFVMGEEEMTDKQKEYRKFFVSAMKKHGASSPTEMSDAKKKQFFNYVKTNWKG
jgi:hypothetical protein